MDDDQLNDEDINTLWGFSDDEQADYDAYTIKFMSSNAVSKLDEFNADESFASAEAILTLYQGLEEAIGLYALEHAAR